MASSIHAYPIRLLKVNRMIKGNFHKRARLYQKQQSNIITKKCMANAVRFLLFTKEALWSQILITKIKRKIVETLINFCKQEVA